MLEKSAQFMIDEGLNKDIDSEWVDLIIMAKLAGVPIEEIRRFLRGNWAAGQEHS